MNLISTFYLQRCRWRWYFRNIGWGCSLCYAGTPHGKGSSQTICSYGGFERWRTGVFSRIGDTERQNQRYVSFLKMLHDVCGCLVQEILNPNKGSLLEIVFWGLSQGACKAWQIGSWWGITTSKPVMVTIVSSIPTGGNFIFCWNFLKPLDVSFVQKYQKCQICIRKNSIDVMKLPTVNHKPR